MVIFVIQQYIEQLVFRPGSEPVLLVQEVSTSNERHMHFCSKHGSAKKDTPASNSNLRIADYLFIKLSSEPMVTLLLVSA